MAVTVLYFAALRDALGLDREQLELPEAAITVARLVKILEERRPALSARVASLRVAVNESFAADGDLVRGGDVVALIPPVAGG